MTGEYWCTSPNLQSYLRSATDLLCRFRDVELSHQPREENEIANDLAQITLGYKEPMGGDHTNVLTRLLPSIHMREPMIAPVEAVEDWRQPLINYLKDPNSRVDYKIKKKALSYCLLDEQLYKKTTEEVILKCLGAEEALVVMGETHEGLCGAHLTERTLRWSIWHLGYY